MSVGQLNAMDPNSFNELKRLAREKPDSPETLRAAAKQFEALFLQMALKAMRDATPKDGMFDSEQTRMYQSMLDQQLALEMAQGRGTGLSDAIYRQLGGKTELPGNVIQPLNAGKEENTGFDIGNVIRRPAAINAASSATAALSKAQEAFAAIYGDDGEASALASWLEVAIQGAREAGGQASSRARAFVDEVWPHAVEAGRATGIPPQFLVAQAALETGWGEKVLRDKDGSSSYNLFNIKAGSSWSGDTVARDVTEYSGGGAYTERARFRSYDSYADSFRDYANLLAGSSRYAGVLGQTDAASFARSLQQAGYATDPMYADKLTRVIRGTTLRTALAG